MNLQRGSVVLVNLYPVVGHEQGEQRPAVIVNSAAVAGAQRYPLLAIVPCTTTDDLSVWYPRLQPSRDSGLRKVSVVLIDQVRAIDRERIVRFLGNLGTEELATIDVPLRAFLGL